MRDFRSPKVWHKAYLLTLDVYRVSRRFPKEELYGLTSQIRRSAASIAANIAEGCGWGGVAELGRFVQISMGSASELEFHLLLARDLGLLNDTDSNALLSLVVELKRMLIALSGKLKADR